MAKLYFSYAAMNAGKSTLLLQAAYNYRERGMDVLLLTSALYRDAENGQISSRIGISADATLYTGETNLYGLIEDHKRRHRLDAVFVDEAQFLTKDQVWQLARVADHIGIPVLTYGLRTDFLGELFEGSAALLAIADSLREVRTICECGRKATMVVRLGPDGKALTEGDQISIAKSTYVSLCRHHWEEHMGRFPPK
jgi:thymidine kinase